MAPPYKIRVGHSPDADDAFMFYAIAKGKIPLDGLQIEHVIEDIESLNQRAMGVGAGLKPAPTLEVTALSCRAFALVSNRYQLLPYGASVGDGYGPVVVRQSRGIASVPPPAADPRNDGKLQIRGKRVAVPGRYTTAYLTLQLYESDFEPVFTPFDQIFSVLREGKADFGLLIHEGQLTYRESGFEKVVDLGEWWRGETGLPLPLGINVIRKDLEEEIKTRFVAVFLRSIEYAMSHREEALNYALKFGRGIDTQRGNQFVEMYVNRYSLEFGESTKTALRLLFTRGWEKRLFPSPVKLEVFQSTDSNKLSPPWVTGLV